MKGWLRQHRFALRAALGKEFPIIGVGGVMSAADARAKVVADFVKRFKYKGSVYEISALTREGCEHLIKDIYKHIKAQQVAEQAPVYVDPRFVEQTP